MTHSPGRLVSAATVLSLLAGGLTGCGLLDGSSPVEDALEYLPADATTVQFVDRAAIADRSPIADREGYATELAAWVDVMQDAGFSDLDITWEASGTSTDDGRVRVWKLDDDVDFDDLADDLNDAGYDSEGSGDVETFEISVAEADEDGLYGGRYPSMLTSLALVPDEHLVLSGAVELAVDVAGDDEDSLSDAGTFTDLLDRAADADDLEFAGLTVEPCGLAVFADPDGVRAVRLFDDAETARSDAEGLEDLLADRAATTGFDVDLDVQSDGEAVTADASFGARRVMAQAWSRRDGPFACPSAE
ncbi:MAG TPA: hypothetical protein VNS46_20050 [Nocardioides sp.]|nr:hypothetical protein [Nocardioides sp.]